MVATGHNIGHSEELYETHPRVAADSTLRALRGEAPRYVRNPEVLEAWRERCARLDAAAGRDRGTMKRGRTRCDAR